MSATATFRVAERTSAATDTERGHRIRLRLLYVLAIVSNLAIFIYGFDYYKLSALDRPFSPKHRMLQPSGPIGLSLGFVGVALFIGIFLYPIRKHWAWLGRIGKSRHWLDIHVLMGLTAPLIIAFHSTFKFKGLVGIAFWIMLAVSFSGVVGRYLYAQIPRRVTSVELSMKELRELQERLSQQLSSQRLLPEADLRALRRMPNPQQAARLPTPVALIYMIVLDGIRKFGVARLRRHASAAWFPTFFGFVPTKQKDLEEAIQTAAGEAALSKRLLFLSRAQKLFHAWHVIHKPFSYAFAVIALMHIILQFLLGYF